MGRRDTYGSVRPMLGRRRRGLRRGLSLADSSDNNCEGVGKVWYNALTDEEFKKPENQTFVGWKALTLKHAEGLFGTDRKNKLKAAWEKVGL